MLFYSLSLFSQIADIYAAVLDCLTGNDIGLSSPLNYGTPSSRRAVDTPRTPGAMGTPMRPRADIQNERRGLTVNMGSSEAVSQTSSDQVWFPNIYKCIFQNIQSVIIVILLLLECMIV